MPYNYVKPTKYGKGFYKSFRQPILSQDDLNKYFVDMRSKIRTIASIIDQRISQRLEVSDVWIETLVDFFKSKREASKTNVAKSYVL